MIETTQPDAVMGAWVYCKSHVGPHTTGWCSVDVGNKIPLKAERLEDAIAEVRAMGLRIYGYCDVCGKWIANEHPYSRECPEHGEAA